MLKYSNNSSFDASVMFRRKHDKQELPLGTLGGSDNSSSASGIINKANMSNPDGYPSEAARPTESSQLVPKYSGYERVPLTLGSVLNHSIFTFRFYAENYYIPLLCIYFRSGNILSIKQSADADTYILLF